MGKTRKQEKTEEKIMSGFRLYSIELDNKIISTQRIELIIIAKFKCTLFLIQMHNF
ncbi:hypothetical protein FPC831_1440003 [Flavobacterium psychrophilum]|nr:hypothetical protein FPC831_1440003 [Flavobacterium psychrophilum]